MTKGASGAGFGGAANSGGRWLFMGGRCVRDGAAGAPPPATGAGLGGVWGGGGTGRGGIGDGRTSSTSTGRDKSIGGASGRSVPSNPNRARCSIPTPAATPALTNLTLRGDDRLLICVP
ncbi:hypothetical protein D3C81_1455270 [compost metagenome]